jgi:hypothetical protein
MGADPPLRGPQTIRAQHRRTSMKTSIGCLALVWLALGAGTTDAQDALGPRALPKAATDVPATCLNLDGASVFSQELAPVYLGFFGSAGALNSIENFSGPYGSPGGANSVRNPTTPYGSSSSNFSANNPFALRPPLIVKYGFTIALLTTNAGASSSEYPYEVDRISLATIDQACRFVATAPEPTFTDQTGAGLLDVSFTGFWWNPNRSGEGLLLEFGELGGNPLLFLTFFTYDLAGNPLYLAGSAFYPRNSADPVSMQVVSTRGGRFGANFNPADVQRTPWGTMTVAVNSCGSITLSFASSVAGYGSGSIQMERFLDRDAFTTCP